jgi:hypothetical protein
MEVKDTCREKRTDEEDEYNNTRTDIGRGTDVEREGGALIHNTASLPASQPGLLHTLLHQSVLNCSVIF